MSLINASCTVSKLIPFQRFPVSIRRLFFLRVSNPSYFEPKLIYSELIPAWVYLLPWMLPAILASCSHARPNEPWLSPVCVFFPVSHPIVPSVLDLEGVAHHCVLVIQQNSIPGLLDILVIEININRGADGASELKRHLRLSCCNTSGKDCYKEQIQQRETWFRSPHLV